MFGVRRAVFAALLGPAVLAAQASSRGAAPPGATEVGPPRGTVIVVGGGSMGPEIYSRFIEAAGGPNALIIDVPAAGGDSVYGQDAPGTRGWKQEWRKEHLRLPHDRPKARRLRLVRRDPEKGRRRLV